ncbi:lipoprotein [Streptomyces sp. NPDC058632]|uniref:lipoprotein n=1 Tax=Streptomyces sp. NPDC058632 TaxID=3346567 RepID=UPI00364B15E0
MIMTRCNLTRLSFNRPGCGMHRTLFFRLVAFILVGGSIAACTSPSDGDSWQDDLAPVPATTTVGGSNSACRLPVTFDIAESWVPETVDADERGGTPGQGTVSLACEIDAKPAGHAGFLRVWASEDTKLDSREVLNGYMAEETGVEEPTYRETKAGPFPATEVTYLKPGAAEAETKRERALAVELPQGSVVLQLGGLDTREHENMLPAYVLARNTMRDSITSAQPVP